MPQRNITQRSAPQRRFPSSADWRVSSFFLNFSYLRIRICSTVPPLLHRAHAFTPSIRTIPMVIHLKFSLREGVPSSAGTLGPPSPLTTTPKRNQSEAKAKPKRSQANQSETKAKPSELKRSQSEAKPSRSKTKAKPSEPKRSQSEAKPSQSRTEAKPNRSQSEAKRTNAKPKRSQANQSEAKAKRSRAKEKPKRSQSEDKAIQSKAKAERSRAKAKPKRSQSKPQRKRLVCTPAVQTLATKTH
jgi:hypothetical protein